MGGHRSRDRGHGRRHSSRGRKYGKSPQAKHRGYDRKHERSPLMNPGIYAMKDPTTEKKTENAKNENSANETNEQRIKKLNEQLFKENQVVPTQKKEDSSSYYSY